MALTIASLNDLSTTEVQAALDLAVQLLSEWNPSVDLRRGVIHDLLLMPHSALAAAQQENINRLQLAMSLASLIANPAIATDALVDAVAYNFNVVRKSGGTATGTVTVVLNKQTAVTIAAGTVFEAQGQQFVTPTSFSARTTAGAVVANTDRLLTAMSDGTYAFNITVTASTAGSAGLLPANTILLPVGTIPYFVKAYSVSDFSGGADVESNASLLSRLIYGRAAKTCGSRISNSSALRAETAFENVVTDSLVGFGDAEMQRATRGIFPISVPGRWDWYVRTQALPQRITLTKTATYIANDVATGHGIWQFSIDRDDAPGFYDVVRVAHPGSTSSGTYVVISDTRGTDLTALDNDGFLPDILTSAESAFTRFQTAVVRFLDTDTATTSLTAMTSTQTVSVTVRVLPLLADIQDFASARKFRNSSDVLVKAPLPCFLSLSFSVELQPGATTPDTNAIKETLASAVNAYGFTGRLPASYLTELVHQQLGATKAYLGAIDMFGRIRRPDQTIRYVRTTNILQVPNEPTSMMSGRTVAFYLDPADIAISVTTANILEV